MTRIHVIGPPGSGKTTLAQRLASQLSIPFHELDFIAWEEGYPGTDRPLEDRLHDIHEIAVQPAWITEGIFLFWTDELLRTADYLVWLDMPWHLIIKRIVARRFRWDLNGGENGVYPPTSPFKQIHLLWRLTLYYLSRSGAETRAYIAKHLVPYQHKLTYCRRPSEVEAFITKVLAQEQVNKSKH